MLAKQHVQKRVFKKEEYFLTICSFWKKICSFFFRPIGATVDLENALKAEPTLTIGGGESRERASERRRKKKRIAI